MCLSEAEKRVVELDSREWSRIGEEEMAKRW